MIEQIPKFNKGDGLSAKQLYELQQAEMRHERELKRKRGEERIARAKRSLEMLEKNRVDSNYFRNLEKNNLITRVKTDSYGRVQRG
ncbi:hypothetical protein [Staphylococcus warneri]|uniref:hypothetical protein n=1 Tax=Staphylococcus warneri TaxID=1292 RepID=UPI001FB1D489|nr:hypothetical protein [Staphylococcus warneri]MCJ1786319.1 hypothetical protein [Staphylococcus warneri]MCJ1788747.1 hypothetical protein [Staphylococcus warneri]MCJ1791175.1 hypothetical protein [Staphylococcus warneri]MCJ1793634.1 hypothetical protein [Staphylococcus warneri]MCJ1796150.1 hypothetical protein [Staphylococcus warneri]